MKTVDPVLLWIVGSGLLMSAIALVGSVTLMLSERVLQRILLPLVAFAAGSLLGGAFFHMLPVGLAADMSDVAVYSLVLSRSFSASSSSCTGTTAIARKRPARSR